MRYSLAKFLGLAPLGIHVMWIEITCLSRMQNNVGLCNRATSAGAR
jgi:hypothetical protein